MSHPIPKSYGHYDDPENASESFDWSASDDEGPYEGESARKTQVSLVLTPPAHPSSHTEVRDERDDLILDILRDHVTKWEDENGWEHASKYKEYEKRINELLKKERVQMPTLSFTNSPQERQNNLLQYILEKATMFDLDQHGVHMAKFLVRLITKLDATQFTPTQDHPKLLHAAALFDIRQLKENRKRNSGLTLYMCNLLGDSAAARICDINADGENVLHLAIRHNFEGLKELIEMAHVSAFRQKRSHQHAHYKSQPDEGNTPLHDALDFTAHFMMPSPVCTILRRLPQATEAHDYDANQLSSFTSRARTATTTPMLETPRQSDYGGNANQPPCPECATANLHFLWARNEWRDTINLLVKRCPEALEISNKAGLPPYQYLLNTRALSLKGEQRDSDPVALTHTLLDKERGNLTQRPRPNTSDTPSTMLEVSVSQSVEQKVTTHSTGDLKLGDIGSDYILRMLRSRIYRLVTYSKVKSCLFSSRKGLASSCKHVEIKQQRDLSLAGRQRIRRNTTVHFNFLHFEPMMASVFLSLEYTQDELQGMPPDHEQKLAMWRDDEENVKTFFKWLKTDKKVKTILSLTVKDNPNHYCSDDTVRQCLSNLEIMYLDWNRPNMCANKFALPSSLLELSLYWTGLDVVLWSWSDVEGLRTLNKLQNVYLHIQKGTENEEELRRKVDHFTQRVAKWPTHRKPQIMNRGFDSQLEGSGIQGLSTPNSRQMHSWMTTAREFGKNLLSFHRHQKPKGCVKIALLDDGVDPTYRHNGQNLHCAGWPTIDSGQGDHSFPGFYKSTHQHGSKMAWLIRSVCPFANIYVAKLDVENGSTLQDREFNIKQAIEAIQWAINCKVDIISMSWNLQEIKGPSSNNADIQELNQALQNAANAGILLFGAACDNKESPSSAKWLPCEHPMVWSIGATDRDYDVKKYVRRDKFHYLFPGEYVLDSDQKEDVEVGNSGATALAAGLAATVLSCKRLANHSIPQRRYEWMSHIFTNVFNSEKNGKSVRVVDVLTLMRTAEDVEKLAEKFSM
ncbi:hypothetical protein GGR50DRAFT_691531 [Xylaria sp. CBS 124048]|nr:hypothetical protein GGR50DRAFT_691531 [Xylaria sp. CBS 124048]